MKPFEDLMNKFKVDLALSGHVHQYHRTKKVFGFQPIEENVDNKFGTVHVIAGHSGTHHKYTTEEKPNKKESEILDEKFYFGGEASHLMIHLNENRLYGQLVQSNNGGILDDFIMMSQLYKEDGYDYILWICLWASFTFAGCLLCLVYTLNQRAHNERDRRRVSEIMNQSLGIGQGNFNIQLGVSVNDEEGRTKEDLQDNALIIRD